jgi:predicted transcriptional regulator
VYLNIDMERDEMVGDDETKTTIKIPTDLLDDFKHLAIDMKTTVTALIVESMRQYLKDLKKK